MNMRDSMFVESVESIAALATDARAGDIEAERILLCMDLPVENQELVGFLKGLQFAADLVTAAAVEDCAKLAW